MKRVFSFFLFSFLMSLVALAQDPQGVKNIDLPDMYRQIDEAISQSPRYIADYEEKISKAKQALETANEEQRLMLLMEISRMYESFCGDSAQVYTERALELARQNGYNEIEGECMARLAYLCTFLGSQTESLTLLGRMSPHALSSEALVTYYRAYMMVYNNLSNNTQLQQMRQEFGELYACYMDSLLATAPEGSEMYYRHREPQLVSEGRLEEALKMNTQRLNMTTDGSHENAIVCYSRYTIYREMGDMEMAKYWLCRSALDDVRNAVLDQMSLIALAELLEAEGATERASRYISFTWECNRRYSPRMRSWQIAPLLTAIEDSYEAKILHKSRILTIWGGVVSLLSIFFVIVLFCLFRQRKQLKAARQQLEDTNKHLVDTNSKLKRMNDWVSKSNAEWQAENKKLKEGIKGTGH